MTTSGVCECGSRTVTVLFVDDDEDTRFCYQLIANEGGLIVELARDGREAIRVASALLPDVIVLDLGLRSADGLDGFEVASRLRAGAHTSSIPIVIVSGSSNASDLAKVQSSGYEGYLVKPCSSEELIELLTLLALTRRAQEASRIAVAQEVSR